MCPSPSLLFGIFAGYRPQRIVGPAFYITVPPGNGILLNGIQRIGHAAEHINLSKGTEESLLLCLIRGILVGKVYSNTIFIGGDLVADRGRGIGGGAHCFVEFFLLILYDFKADLQCGILRMVGVGISGTEICGVDLCFVGGPDFLCEIQEHRLKKLASGYL